MTTPIESDTLEGPMISGASADADRATAATQSNPQAVSSKAGIPSAWHAGAFTTKTVSGERLIAGWLSDEFALDFRTFEDAAGIYGAWHLTHVATGYSVCHFKDEHFASVVSLVDELREVADWSFCDPSEAKDAAFGFSEFRDNNQPAVQLGPALLSCAAISPSPKPAHTGPAS